MAPWEFVEWLLFWIIETSHFEFEWDKGNQTKDHALMLGRMKLKELVGPEKPNFKKPVVVLVVIQVGLLGVG